MSADSHFKVDYIAALARLELSEEEATRYQEQLDAIISYIEELSEVDVEGVEPTAHPAPVFDRLRDDEAPAFSIDHEAVLENAPDQALEQIRVPKVVDA